MKYPIMKTCKYCKGKGSVPIYDDQILHASSIPIQIGQEICGWCNGKGSTDTGHFVEKGNEYRIAGDELFKIVDDVPPELQ